MKWELTLCILLILLMHFIIAYIITLLLFELKFVFFYQNIINRSSGETTEWSMPDFSNHLVCLNHKTFLQSIAGAHSDSIQSKTDEMNQVHLFLFWQSVSLCCTSQYKRQDLLLLPLGFDLDCDFDFWLKKTTTKKHYMYMGNYFILFYFPKICWIRGKRIQCQHLYIFFNEVI